MAERKSGPVFIVGTPRSGTTLTARIVGRNPAIYMPRETPFFHDIYSRRKKLGDPADPATREKIISQLLSLHARYNSPGMHDLVTRVFSDGALRAQLHSCTTYKSMFSFFMECLSKTENKVRWGNNVPNDIFYIDDILEFYPDAIVLICVRDVRDYLLSYRDKWRRSSGANVRRMKNLYHPVLTTLLWKSSMRLIPDITSKVRPGHWMIVKYEELTSDPEATVREICKVMGEDFHEDMLDISSNNSSTLTTQAGIYSSSVGRWKTLLEPTVAAVAQRLARKEMKWLGYQPERRPVEVKELIRIFGGLPLAVYKALRANSSRRGALVPYLASRLRALCVPQDSTK